MSSQIDRRKLSRALPLGWAQPCEVDTIFFFPEDHSDTYLFIQQALIEHLLFASHGPVIAALLELTSCGKRKADGPWGKQDHGRKKRPQGF